MRDFLASVAEIVFLVSTIAMMFHISLVIIVGLSLSWSFAWLIPIAAGAFLHAALRGDRSEEFDAWTVR